MGRKWAWLRPLEWTAAPARSAQLRWACEEGAPATAASVGQRPYRVGLGEARRSGVYVILATVEEGAPVTAVGVHVE
jgi:hypothetical protein